MKERMGKLGKRATLKSKYRDSYILFKANILYQECIQKSSAQEL